MLMLMQVYEAEKVVTRTRVYHRSCLACSVCSRGLEAATATEAGDGRVYCRGCYSRHCCTTLYCTVHYTITMLSPGSSAAWPATGTGRGRGCGPGRRRRGAPGAGTRCSAWTRWSTCSISPVTSTWSRWWRARASCTTASVSPAPPAPPSSPPPASAAGRTGTSTAAGATAPGDRVPGVQVVR